MYNYHTHTTRCMHASGTEEEYVLQAIEAGFGLLGFSDHTPWPYEDDFVGNYHMAMNQYPDYRDTVLALKKKYEGQIQIRLGLECEYFPAYISWLQEEKAKGALDYLIMGNHFHTADNGGQYQGDLNTPSLLRAGADMLIKGMETGLYMYVCHPDLVLRAYPKFDENALAAARDICRASVALDVPLEYNLLGVAYGKRGMHTGLGYPCGQFWEVAAQEGVTAVIGADVHRLEQLRDLTSWHEAEALLDSLGMKRMERRA